MKWSDRIVERCNLFWRLQPALLYGLACLLGCQAALSKHWIVALPIGLLFAPLLFGRRQCPELNSRLLLSFALFIAVFVACTFTYQWPKLPQEGIHGVAEIAISRLSKEDSAFGEQWRLDGELLHFSPTNTADRERLRVVHAPLQMTFKAESSSERPQANSAYRLYGTLKQVHGHYRLKADTSRRWTPLPGHWSLAEWRYTTKEAFGRWLHKQISNPHTAAFLVGLMTGEFSDRQIRSALGRFGLQHVMAISGFHFAIVAAVLGLLLTGMLSRRTALILMLLMLTAYQLFLGPSASIVRAWVAVMVVLAGQLLARRPRGLNSLGVALLLILLFDPTSGQSVAFQLSFLATGSILLFFPFLEARLRWIFPKRRLSQAVALTLWEQHGVIILALLRGALALMLAVHIVMIPMALYYFHKFPWLSLVFNLFFPFLVSVSMLLLLVALPVYFMIPPLAACIHGINNWYTQWVLNLTIAFPTTLDCLWRVSEVPTSCIVAYLSAVGIAGVMIGTTDQARGADSL